MFSFVTDVNSTDMTKEICDDMPVFATIEIRAWSTTLLYDFIFGRIEKIDSNKNNEKRKNNQ